VHNKSGGDEKRQNPKANANAMYCNRRTRDKDRLKEWIHDIKLELDPRMSKFYFQFETRGCLHCKRSSTKFLTASLFPFISSSLVISIRRFIS
jgi:hypothetical protein